MARNLRSAEVEAILSLNDNQARYGYVVKQIADAGSLWVAESDNGRCKLVFEDGDPGAIAIWPHRDFAERYLSSELAADWHSVRPVEVEIHFFIESEIPLIGRANQSIAALPTPAGRVVVVSARDFEANLRHELSRIEE
jgi:hypothetical protein